MCTRSGPSFLVKIFSVLLSASGNTSYMVVLNLLLNNARLNAFSRITIFQLVHVRGPAIIGC